MKLKFTPNIHEPKLVKKKQVTPHPQEYKLGHKNKTKILHTLKSINWGIQIK
jgi:hypothetical protein